MPLYQLQETKAEIERVLENGVISPVDEPTEWCAPMVVTPKDNNKVRVCVDLTKLNNFVQREIHPLPSVDTTQEPNISPSSMPTLDSCRSNYLRDQRN